jgi:hypothetical protein
MPRDSRRGKLYKAEREAQLQMKLRDVSTPRLYEQRVRAIEASAWWIEMQEHSAVQFGPIKLDFLKRKGGASAWGTYRIITGTSPWVMNELVLIHEMAHIAHHRIKRVSGTYDSTGHGRHYAEIYLEMVGRFIGVEARKLLRAAFRKYRVKVGKPRAKKPMTEEQRAILVERMAMAREAKKLMRSSKAATIAAMAGEVVKVYQQEYGT